MLLLLIYIMFCVLGGIVGAYIKKKKIDIGWSSKVQMLMLIVLLVTMGARLGLNKNIVANLGDIGITAFLFTIFVMVGSVGAVFAVRKFFKINKKGEKS